MCIQSSWTEFRRLLCRACGCTSSGSENTYSIYCHRPAPNWTASGTCSFLGDAAGVADAVVDEDGEGYLGTLTLYAFEPRLGGIVEAKTHWERLGGLLLAAIAERRTPAHECKVVLSTTRATRLVHYRIRERPICDVELQVTKSDAPCAIVFRFDLGGVSKSP
ncbi:MAG: hypothetical protein U1A27_10165 [Phycisphaerae bacterium]